MDKRTFVRWSKEYFFLPDLIMKLIQNEPILMPFIDITKSNFHWLVGIILIEENLPLGHRMGNNINIDTLNSKISYLSEAMWDWNIKQLSLIPSSIHRILNFDGTIGNYPIHLHISEEENLDNTFNINNTIIYTRVTYINKGRRKANINITIRPPS